MSDYAYSRRPEHEPDAGRHPRRHDTDPRMLGYGRAVRHSSRIRFLRRVLPVLALLILGLAGFIAWLDPFRIVRDFPLETVHENAFQAALAANAANKQGKYFEYIEFLYRNQDALDKESLKKYAAEAGLNLAQFELDFQSETNAAEIRKDIADGKNYGITGTPTIYVNGVKVRHNTFEDFREAIEAALKK